MRRARIRQRVSLLSVLAAAFVALTSCTVAAQVAATPTADVETRPATSRPAPTTTVAPNPTPTTITSPNPTPAPTAAPTTTPTPKPLVSSYLLELTIDAAFDALTALGLEYSFALFDEEAGLLEKRNSDRQLLPASNQKLVTAVGALELLPDDFRFSTELRLSSDLDVFVVGGGDPTLTRAHVAELAGVLADRLAVEVGPAEGALSNGADGDRDDDEDELEAADIGIVVGDLVVDVSHFPPTRTGPGWPARYVPGDVGPMSGLMIDDNQHRGDAAYVADPDLGNALLIEEIFEAAGITVSGHVRVGSADATAAIVAVNESVPRDALVQAVLSSSDNEVADGLLREIGLRLGGIGEIPNGQAFVFDQVALLGVDLGDPLGDGSGLSRDARLSAAELVQVLRLATKQEWWPVVDEGLSEADVDEALGARVGVDIAQGRIRAKTGTLDDARALSGILTTLDDRELLFSLIVNGNSAEDGVEFMDRLILALTSSTFAQLSQ